MRVLKELAKEELSWKALLKCIIAEFQIIFRILKGTYQNKWSQMKESLSYHQPEICRKEKKIKKLREEVKKGGKRMDECMVKKHTTLQKNIVYRNNDKILVRI